MKNKTQTLDMVDFTNDLFETISKAFRPMGQRPDLACPHCHARAYVIVLDNNTCWCDNCEFTEEIGSFEMEGEKWDDIETANSY